MWKGYLSFPHLSIASWFILRTVWRRKTSGAAIDCNSALKQEDLAADGDAPIEEKKAEDLEHFDG